MIYIQCFCWIYFNYFLANCLKFMLFFFLAKISTLECERVSSVVDWFGRFVWLRVYVCLCVDVEMLVALCVRLYGYVDSLQYYYSILERMGMVAFYNRQSTRFKVAYLTEIKSVSGFTRTTKKKKTLDSAACCFFFRFLMPMAKTSVITRIIVCRRWRRRS